MITRIRCSGKTFPAYTNLLKRKQDDGEAANTFHYAPSQWKQMAVHRKEEILGRWKQFAEAAPGIHQ